MKLTLLPHQRLWFTSDTHYNHSNICRGTSNWPADSKTRDFDTLDKMNATMINNINHVVGEDDILFHLGDWSFGGFENIQEFRDRIVCKNIHLVLGNHDHHIERNKGNIQKLFASVNEYVRLEVTEPNVPTELHPEKTLKKTLVLCHYPIASWHDMNKGVIQLHGHVHLGPQNKLHEGRAMDVGMDGNSMEPYSLQEISKIMKKRPVKCLVLPNDHHETNESQ
jgi:calcineurin-like phosphoesterase family protein